MSVQTQIDRISDAVSAVKAALTEKGVTVPDGTKVDGLAALIAAIEAGGVVVETGTITLAQNGNLTIGLSKNDVHPDVVVIFHTPDATGSVTGIGASLFVVHSANDVDVYNYGYTSTSSFSSIKLPYVKLGYDTPSWNASTGFTARGAGGGSYAVYVSGKPYRWYALWGGT